MKEPKIRERNFRLLLLNIKLRPSGTDEQYLSLLKSLYELKQPIRLRGEEFMVFKNQKESECMIATDRKTKVLYGKIVRYTKIDGKDWFDLNIMDKAENVEIPSNVFPNLKETEYFFFPEAHRLAFIKTSGFSPNSVRLFVETLMKQVKLGDDQFEVNVVTDSVEVSRILCASEIRRLFVNLSYSNADEHESAAAVLDELYRGSNANTFKGELSGTIDPNSELVKAYLELSGSNGYAEASVKEQGDSRFKTIKTTDYPQVVDIKSEDTSLILKVALYVINRWRKNKHGQ